MPWAGVDWYGMPSHAMGCNGPAVACHGHCHGNTTACHYNIKLCTSRGGWCSIAFCIQSLSAIAAAVAAAAAFRRLYAAALAADVCPYMLHHTNVATKHQGCTSLWRATVVLLRRHLRLDGTNATSRPPPKRHVAAAAAAAAASNYLRPHQNHQAPHHFRFTPGFFGILWQLVLGQHFSTFFPTRALTIPPSIMSSCSSSGTVAQRLLLSPSHLQPLKPNSIS